jgi:hypothetical protein
MASFSVTKTMKAPLETVFDVATDLGRAAERIRGIESVAILTPGPMGPGTRWRETRKMMGHQSTETFEVIAFDPPRSYSFGCETCGSYMRSTFRFEPNGDATDVELEVGMEARTLFAKLMSPLGNLMFGKTMRKCLDDDLEDIKRAAESQTR